MKQMWDKRYTGEDYFYGIQPNNFFKDKINDFKPGKILLPAEGEGRKSVYAAGLGWDVSAFDYSTEARGKALRLSKENNVQIDYSISSLEDADYEKESFDMLVLIYAHSKDRQNIHRRLLTFLKPGGVIVLEAFSKKQRGNDSGGPKDINMLFSIEELKNDFSQLRELDVREEEIVLAEGDHHSGKASVIRLLGRK
ncbi:MAG: class I SAM-dependent methyltransferase [Candidatus Kapabacteria bacterium]|nr:class I SAM-dependent methyltransferase [Candidatus Kapabacteria bacterium]